MRGVALLAPLVIAAAVPAEERVRLEDVKTEWQNAYGAIIYTALANVKNVSETPIVYVKVQVALFDKDGKPVAERTGYNEGAEILGVVELPGSFEDKLKRVKPIPPGGTDLVRISLDKTDIGKPFRSAKVTLIEVH